MGKVIKLNKEIPNADDPPLRVEVHVCGLCGSENFWLYKKPISEDFTLHVIACSACGNQVQGTWQPNEALHLT